MGLRQKADGPCPPLPPIIKLLEIHSLWTETSKRRVAGQLREEAGSYFLLSKSKDLLNHTCTDKLLGGQRRVVSRDVPYPYALSVKSVLAKRCVCTHGRILRYIKYGL